MPYGLLLSLNKSRVAIALSEQAFKGKVVSESSLTDPMRIIPSLELPPPPANPGPATVHNVTRMFSTLFGIFIIYNTSMH